MDISKIRKAKRSDRLVVLEEEFLEGKKDDPEAILELEMALRALQKVGFTIDNENGTIVMATFKDPVEAPKVIVNGEDGVVVRQTCSWRYNAYKFLESYLGIGQYEDAFDCFAMAEVFPEIGPSDRIDSGNLSLYSKCYDQLAERLLGFAKNHLCDPKKLGKTVIEMQTGTRIVRVGPF